MTESEQQLKKLTIPEMLAKLDEFYDKEEALKKELLRLKAIYDETKEEIELIQTMIMFKSNRDARRTEFKKKG